MRLKNTALKFNQIAPFFIIFQQLKKFMLNENLMDSVFVLTF